MAIFPGALGDLLLALPALRALRARHAGPWTLVVAEPLRGLARLAGVAEVVASLDAADAAWLFGASTQPPWLGGTPIVHTWLGGDDARLARVARAVHRHRIERGPAPIHAALAYAAAVGAPMSFADACAAARLAPPLPTPRVAALLEAHGRLLAFHRGAGGRARRWNNDGFVEIARRWIAQGGAVLDVRGPADDDLPACPGTTPVDGWPLPELAALLAASDVWLGHDTGPSHLAAAVGLPGVVLFGPSSPDRWRPTSERMQPVTTGGRLDLDALPVSRVWATVAQAGQT